MEIKKNLKIDTRREERIIILSLFRKSNQKKKEKEMEIEEKELKELKRL